MASTPLQRATERLRKHEAVRPQRENYGDLEREEKEYQAKCVKRQRRYDRVSFPFLVVTTFAGLAVGVVAGDEFLHEGFEGRLLGGLLGGFFGLILGALLGLFMAEWIVGSTEELEKPQSLIRYKNDLRDWFAQGFGINSEYRKLFAAERKKQRDYWLQLTPRQFEREVASLYEKRGYTAKVVGGSGDEGVDIELRKSGGTVVVQCKAHKNPVSPGVVRELLGTKVAAGSHEAILVARGGATSGAKSFAKEHSIEIVDLDQIVAMSRGSTEGNPPGAPPVSPSTVQGAELPAPKATTRLGKLLSFRRPSG